MTLFTVAQKRRTTVALQWKKVFGSREHFFFRWIECKSASRLWTSRHLTFQSPAQLHFTFALRCNPKLVSRSGSMRRIQPERPKNQFQSVSVITNNKCETCLLSREFGVLEKEKNSSMMSCGLWNMFVLLPQAGLKSQQHTPNMREIDGLLGSFRECLRRWKFKCFIKALHDWIVFRATDAECGINVDERRYASHESFFEFDFGLSRTLNQLFGFARFVAFNSNNMKHFSLSRRATFRNCIIEASIVALCLRIIYER